MNFYAVFYSEREGAEGKVEVQPLPGVPTQEFIDASNVYGYITDRGIAICCFAPDFPLDDVHPTLEAMSQKGL